MLDLAITLTPPPPGSPPDTLASATLRCDALGPIECTGALPQPVTQKEHDLLTWYLEEYWKWPYEGFAERGRAAERLIEEVGKRLYRMLAEIPGSLRILEPWRLQPGAERQISIITNIPAALAVPWELLHDEQGFLALRTKNPVSVIRRLPAQYAAFQGLVDSPLRVLVVTARPKDAGFLDPRLVGRELFDEMSGAMAVGSVSIEFLRPPTLGQLRERLRQKQPVHILHFDGHGDSGALLFEKANGETDAVKAADLAQVLQDSGVRLVVLTACLSAAGAPDDVFSSVAARLIQSGVDGVTAMSASMLAVSAARYSEAFYRELARGSLSGVAHERARQALHDDPQRHVVRRRGNQAGAPVSLRDWWMPHFYQQRPTVLQVGKKKPRKVSGPPQVSGAVPASPRYGFTGRAWELLRIERELLRQRLVVIHGFGGMGKTAVAMEAAAWLTRTGMYAGACFVSFEHSGDSETLLAAVGRHLGIKDSEYNPRNSEKALERLRAELKKQPALLIADNVESILSGGDAPLAAEDLGRLWEVLRALAKSGAGVLVTTRDTGFGDDRMAPSAEVVHLPLEGLHPDDAYTLAVRVVEDLSIAPERAPYAEVSELLGQLAFHPLAIQLVLPALRDTEIHEIRGRFSELLPRFADDRESGRNQSLLASLEYSLGRLTDEQRLMLRLLAPFEGGGEESEILRITQIPGPQWQTLRGALEQAALVIRQPIHPRNPVLYVRFHPVLTPYLRSLPGATDSQLEVDYAVRYKSLLKYLYNDDTRNPELARSLVKAELANFRHALLMFVSGQVQAVDSTDGSLATRDIAADMADDLTTFLEHFSMTRMAADLWRRVNAGRDTASAGGKLTLADYYADIRVIDDAVQAGDVEVARTRTLDLLSRMNVQALPEGIGFKEQARLICVLSDCLIKTGDYVAAEIRTREAIALFDTAITADPKDNELRTLRGGILLELANLRLMREDLDQAGSLFEEVIKIARKHKHSRLGALALAGQATLLSQRGKTREAEGIFQSLRPVFVRLGEPAKLAGLAISLGAVAQKQGKNDRAETYYREALSIMETIEDPDGVASIYYNLGLVTLDGNPSEAKGWFKRAFDSGRLQGIHLINCLEHLAETTLAAQPGDLEEARGYAKRAFELYQRVGPKAGEASMLGVLADIEEQKGHAEAAREYREKEEEYRQVGAWLEARSELIWKFRAAVLQVIRGDASVPAEELIQQVPWPGTEPVLRRIFAGERDREALVRDLPIHEAALIHLVLDTLEGSAG